MDIAKRPSIASQLSTLALPAPSTPAQLPPPVRLFAATPMERKDTLLGKPDRESPLPRRQTSLPKVQVAPIRLPKRLPSASSYNDLPRSNQGNRPHPQLNVLAIKKSHSNADVASGQVAKQHPSPAVARRQSKSRTHSGGGRGSESDPINPPGNLSSSSDGEVRVPHCYYYRRVVILALFRIFFVLILAIRTKFNKFNTT